MESRKSLEYNKSMRFSLPNRSPIKETKKFQGVNLGGKRARSTLACQGLESHNHVVSLCGCDRANGDGIDNLDKVPMVEAACK